MDKVYILTALEASKNLSQMKLNKIFLIITEQMLLYAWLSTLKETFIAQTEGNCFPKTIFCSNH